jgi:TnpA family transposase
MDAILEGNRIQNLIASAPPASTTESLKFLLKENMVTLDELIGIDNFIMGKPTRVRKIRKRHSAAVLRKQREVRLQQDDAALILGRFAEQNSQKSTQNALVRAAMAT